MTNNFKESQLDPDFCSFEVEQIKKLIRSSITFTVVGLPVMGISIFLKYLTATNLAYFVHVDIYELPLLNILEFFKLLLKQLGGKISKNSDKEVFDLCKERLKYLARNNNRV